MTKADRDADMLTLEGRNKKTLLQCCSVLLDFLTLFCQYPVSHSNPILK